MLKDLIIKNSYISHGENNLVKSLINPSLKEGILYRRTTAFFSSTVFNLLLESLPIFIANKGKIQLLVSPNLSEDDIIAIQTGYENKEKILEKSFIKGFEHEIQMFDEERLNILYQLVLRGILDIKVAAMKDDIGIYHDKLGIITDKNGDSVVFYGSANSSFSGYSRNYEKIRVVKSWDIGNAEIVCGEINEFESLWNNLNPYVEVYKFTESIKKSILTTVDKVKSSKINQSPIQLYDYQKLAIEKWVENGFNGFYVMATGTGKTWTAIYSAKRLYEEYSSLIVIAAPYKHLVKQWHEDVIKVFPNADIILVSSENQSWYKEAVTSVIGQKYDSQRQTILITTIKSFYSDRFTNVLKLSNQEKLLIVDEAHRFTVRTEETKHFFKYMLGLSATPINGKNNEEGNALVRYFGGQVFSLPIEDALEKGFLVSYNYFPIYVDATEYEEDMFADLTTKIIGCFSKEGRIIDKEKLIKLTKARLRLIAMADEKLSRIKELLNVVPEKDHFVVYCGDGKVFSDSSEKEVLRHIQFVKNSLDELGIKTSQFTAQENMVRRMELVEMFNNNEISSLVAIRCLDEGINIPSIKSALILASNDDYREFVQRRGRILRKYPNKKYANIYDVIVLPKTDMPNFAKIELRRFYEYAKLAINKAEKLSELDELLCRYNLMLEDIVLYTELETEDYLDD